ncbi:DUF202 domain-containing protein [Stutzerimonas nitrititolerans]|uniref:DUF202 domain-containing protein n=1 Tax=Stutzerimonas nitrititolerans TaxID=2482751 RepID=UPI00289A81F2|nr:DUF202 domain-containing protein [Stutzerimonas nitrititolerans]
MSGRSDLHPARLAPHDDSGLQPERTSLAWGRTLLALVVTACFFLRWMQWHGWLAGALAVGSLLVALFVWVMQHRRYRAGAAGIRDSRLAPALRSVLLVGLTVAGLAGLSIWGIVTG